jgi:alpha-D-ribose 1-methylphosphonate 5-triphosphate synthase subunit PhnL
MTLLNVSGYSKRFMIHQLARTIPVFEDVSFRLHAGEFLLINGPNGVGKSTLLRCLYRSYLPSAGHARYDSRHGVIDLATAADGDIAFLRATEIGHVTQFLRPRPRVSALELVAEPLLTALSAADAEREARHWLAAFGLKPELWQAYPTTFSGGEQQKVNLARALIRPRRLLLLDEPTASLDTGARAALVARLAELKAEGVALLGVFHHAEDVRELLDGVIELALPHNRVADELLERAYVAE